MRAGAYGADVWAATRRSRGRPRRRPAGRRRRQQQQPQPRTTSRSAAITILWPRPPDIYHDTYIQINAIEMVRFRWRGPDRRSESTHSAERAPHGLADENRAAARSSELCSSNNKSSREAR
eukprot:scaffold14029_cov121-Isochrysis_galbana.AAC.6